MTLSNLKTFRLYLGGVQGVGKTTIAKQIIKKYPKIVHYSTSEILINYFHVKNRKELEKISINQKTREQIFLKMYSMYPFLILDGHFKLTTKDKQNFNLFFFIDASNKTILSRRMKDKTRVRSKDLSIIKQEKEKELCRIKNLGIKPIYIKNEGDIKETLEKIEKKLTTTRHFIDT